MTEPRDHGRPLPEGSGGVWWSEEDRGSGGGPWWPGPDPANPAVNGHDPSATVTPGARGPGPVWWRSRRAVALLLSMAAAFGVGFGLTFARNPSAPSASPNPAPSPSTTAPAGPTDPAAAVLRSVVVQQADVGPSLAVALIPGGDQVTGQTTLDLCNGAFPSESERTARLQDAVADAQGNEVLSTEAVLYHSAADTSQAFAELRSVAAHCPAGPVASPVGEPTVTTRFNPPPDGAWPQVAGVERQAYDFVSTDESGESSHGVAVYLRHGRLLLGAYFQSPDAPQPAVGGQTTIAGIVNVLSQRMARASLTATA
ncbi:MAG TPA: hypothetical protein VFH45_02450 [Acidimicrobiales bacterium]|nr:hypothetical protein [Acidimicrobiales bacterium]